MTSRSTPLFERAGALRRLGEERFDVLVVGGGITGAGVALDAASRGLRTALVERDDFASGTSSKSSKLVHGGLRYLQQREFRLVYEALYERQRALENAPHLVRVLPFLVPVLTRGGVIDRRLARVLGSALWMYDLTGGVRIGKRHHKISVDTALAHMPTLARDRLAGAYVYYDAQADDARLTLTIARTADVHGATIANYAAVRSIVKDGDRVVGARVEADGEEILVRTRAIVNAAGVWADDVRALDEGAHPASIRPAKGIHITVPWSKVRNDIAAIVPVPNDRRSVFVVPWGDTTYIGTTDTDYEGPLDDPPCSAADVDYLLGAINGVTDEKLTEADVVGTWAGLRPLLRQGRSARTADLSRRHSVRTAASGVVTVTGGKLTTYRRMAADAVDAILEVLGERSRPPRTKHLRLFGGEGMAPPVAALEPSAHEHLTGRYGTAADAVRALVADEPELGEPLVAGLPYLKAEAAYAVRSEMARTLDDILARRTRARLLARDASAAAAAEVAALVAPELGWSAAERDASGRGVPLVDRGRTMSPLRGTVAEVPAAVLGRLGGICPVDQDPEAVATASRDWWPLAMIWDHDGTPVTPAAAVVRPAGTADVAAVLRVCDEAGVPVTAAAGRSGVCGASMPVHGGIVLDLTAITGIVGVDPTALVLDVRAGTFGTPLEAALRSDHDVTLGHWPQSIDLSTVGGWLACRSAGQLSTRYGKIEDMVLGLDVVLADGRIVQTGGAPRAAVGPDLNQVFVGSEGTLGVITGARLRVHPAPVAEVRAAFRFPAFAAGLDACRRILRRGATPAVLRLYDAIEADRHFSTGDDAILLVLDEGDAAIVDAVLHVARDECADATPEDPALLDQWLERRNDVSALGHFIELGYVVDTMEIAARWSSLPRVYEGVLAALRGVDGMVLASAHLSHAYVDGACLYFTFGGHPPKEQREGFYRAAWDAAMDATLAGGAALSHHHGIGLNRGRYAPAALGNAFGVLAAMKTALDPHGILNPGKLGLPHPWGEPAWP